MLYLTFTDAFLEASDEEILGYDEESSEDSDDADAKNVSEKFTQQNGEAEEEDEDAGDWGASRKDYYNADQIETEADALEEEAEAKRLQQKKLQKMSEADFGFDENEWLDTAKDEDEGDVVTEVLKDVQITSEMGSKERLQILQTRYPEFEFLANDFLRLQETMQALQQDTERNGTSKIIQIKAQALSAYLASLSMYFAVLTSTSQDGNPGVSAIDPSELREHSVMESLLGCRELWSSVKDLVVVAAEKSANNAPSLLEEGVAIDMIQPNGEQTTKKSRKERLRDASIEEAARARKERIKAAEDGLADLQDLVPNSSTKRAKKSKKTYPAIEDDSDFGEEESLSSKALEEKAQKKKSLRFYTSQIAQKSNRRADAGRDAGGDADLPYRERLRDRQARLNAEAEKRGKKLDSYGRGAALGDDSGDEAEDAQTAAAVRDDEDDYYDMVAQTASKKKSDKAEKYAAIAEAKAAGAVVRVVDGEVGEDGKRGIGYVIEKNKGLAPKRSKDVRNPRVKKRKKYEEKLKKLSSMKAVYKGGEAKGGYGGEATGIKTGLVKSIKL